MRRGSGAASSAAAAAPELAEPIDSEPADDEDCKLKNDKMFQELFGAAAEDFSGDEEDGSKTPLANVAVNVDSDDDDDEAAEAEAVPKVGAPLALAIPARHPAAAASTRSGWTSRAVLDESDSDDDEEN
jgi:hypothetical protein